MTELIIPIMTNDEIFVVKPGDVLEVSLCNGRSISHWMGSIEIGEKWVVCLVVEGGHLRRHSTLDGHSNDTFDFIGLFGDKIEHWYEFINSEGVLWRRVSL